MVQNQRTPWATIFGFTSLFCLIGWLFGAFEPPAKAVPTQPPAMETLAPAVSAPPELTPEQRAQRAAKKARDEEENLKFARDVVVVRQLKSSMKNPASFDLVGAIRMDDGTLCVTYRATNSFNAVIPGEAIITKDRIYTSDKRDRFVAEYNKRCANKSGKGMRHIRLML